MVACGQNRHFLDSSSARPSSCLPRVCSSRTAETMKFNQSISQSSN